MASDAQDNVTMVAAPEGAGAGPAKEGFKRRLKKLNIVLFSVLHLSGLYGFYLMFSGAARWQTILFTIVLNYASILGVTAGAHRLWSHRAYKAKWPLQMLLAVMTSIACQFASITWVRDHRVHHKYSDTDADPHNSKRGLFFSHIGWLMLDKHPDVIRRSEEIDISDVIKNPVLKFQYDHFAVVATLACFILPTFIPMTWNEELWVGWHLNLARFMLSLHCLFLINSAAHHWGNKPYDQHIAPSQNIGVSIANLGEGFHNYHHTFPLDYRAAELGDNFLNPTTKFIDLFAWIGWAYDLKTVSDDLVRERSKRTGDKSR